jgi:hypothetical protein
MAASAMVVADRPPSSFTIRSAIKSERLPTKRSLGCEYQLGIVLFHRLHSLGRYHITI